eukprot:1734281-Alexandrium_andersonii.AAC.1
MPRCLAGVLILPECAEMNNVAFAQVGEKAPSQQLRAETLSPRGLPAFADGALPEAAMAFVIDGQFSGLASLGATCARGRGPVLLPWQTR